MKDDNETFFEKLKRILLQKKEKGIFTYVYDDLDYFGYRKSKYVYTNQSDYTVVIVVLV